MSYTIREHGAVTLVGISLRTNNAVEMTGGQIGAAWGGFMKAGTLARIPHRLEPDEIRAAYFDYQSDYRGDYTFLLGAAVAQCPEVPDGMICKTFAAARYAVFTASAPTEVPAAWQTIWQSEIKRTYRGDFEVYRETSIEIFVGVE